MAVCLIDSGAYCPADFLECRSFVNVCELFKLCLDLLSINFSVVTERDKAHAMIAEVIANAGFDGRFPDGVFIDIDSADYQTLFGSLQQSLDFYSRRDEKLMKEKHNSTGDASDGKNRDKDEFKGGRTSTWSSDDATTSFYKSIEGLNSLLYAGVGFQDRTTYERDNKLVWA
jgi:hypothetical protein